MNHYCYTKAANINVQKLTSLNLEFRTTKMTPVNRKYQNLRPRSLANLALTCYDGSTHARLLSESGRSYILAFRLYVMSCRAKLPKDYLD